MIRVCPPHLAHSHARLVAGLLLAALSTASLAQTPRSGAPEIYTCVDAKGRNLTSDRPIAECLDREQKMLNPSGTVKAKVGPNLTAQERSELEAKEKVELEERARLNEEKRRDRALLVRYPNKAVHDRDFSMAIGDAFAPEDISPWELAEMCERCGLQKRLVAKTLAIMSDKLLKAMDEVDLSLLLPGDETGFAGELIDTIRKNVERYLPYAKQLPKIVV